MAGHAYPTRIACAAAAISMLVTPIAASAQPASTSINTGRVDPLVAFSLFGSTDSRAALCGLSSSSDATTVAVAATSTSTAGATNTEQTDGGMAGCVLPMRDAAALSTQPVAAPLGIPLALLRALGAALASAATVVAADKLDTPISPA